MKTPEILKAWRLNAGASADAIRDAISSLGRSLPPDYVQFLCDHDGGEGFIGRNYLIVWRAEELSIFNREFGWISTRQGFCYLLLTVVVKAMALTCER
jgi:hypothetical protein